MERFKFEEEKDEYFSDMLPRYASNSSDELKNIFPEIKGINSSLLEKEIPCLIISVEKNKNDHIKKLHEAICELRIIQGIKMILYVEHSVDPNDLPVALWRFCNNLDPRRDHFIVKNLRQIKQRNSCSLCCLYWF